MKVKTNELSGVQLDWVVAQIERKEVKFDCNLLFLSAPDFTFGDLYRPAEDWECGGPIIERERIELVAVELGEEWIARDYWKEFAEQSGPTPLVAAMRCYVASKLGEEVEVPNEIV